MNLSDPLHQFQLTSSLCSSIAIASTLYRIYVRRSKLWVDDACVLLAMVALCVQLVATFIPLTPSSGVARYYIMITTFYLTVWISRLSILFSMIRIDPYKLRKRILLGGAFGFLAMCAYLITQLFWTCEPQEAWKSMRLPQCSLTKRVAITQVSFNTLADIIVLVVPLQLLLVLQDRWLRSRLMMIFSTCMITTVASLIHAGFILSSDGPPIVIAALVESSVSLIVCSLPVIATALLHLGEHAPPHLSYSEDGLADSNRNVVPFLGLGQDLQHGDMSIHFITGSHTPTSQISGTVMMAESCVDGESEGGGERRRGLVTKPSSVMLKTDTVRG